MFESAFCIVDLFGHTKIAGMVSEQDIGGSGFVRVDVPETNGQKAFTRFFGPGAIYAIQPVDRETGLAAVRAFQVKPIDLWTIQDMIRKLPANSEKADTHWESVEAELEDIDAFEDEDLHEEDEPL